MELLGWLNAGSLITQNAAHFVAVFAAFAAHFHFAHFTHFARASGPATAGLASRVLFLRLRRSQVLHRVKVCQDFAYESKAASKSATKFTAKNGKNKFRFKIWN